VCGIFPLTAYHFSGGIRIRILNLYLTSISKDHIKGSRGPVRRSQLDLHLNEVKQGEPLSMSSIHPYLIVPIRR
jgi:hypothetical protein